VSTARFAKDSLNRAMIDYSPNAAVADRSPNAAVADHSPNAAVADHSPRPGPSISSPKAIESIDVYENSAGVKRKQQQKTVPAKNNARYRASLITITQKTHRNRMKRNGLYFTSSPNETALNHLFEASLTLA
jgi:hypothetical protein